MNADAATNIVLIGFKSCGKSATSKALAALLNTPCVDTDALMEGNYAAEEHESLSCRELYLRFGAAWMRALESRVLQQVAGRRNTVVSTGGGVVLAPENRELLRHMGVCVFVDTPLPVLERRLSHVDSPLFAHKSIAEVHRERLPLYHETAHVRVCPVHGETPKQLAERISALVAEVNHGQ